MQYGIDSYLEYIELVNGPVWELLKYEWRDGRGRYLYSLRADESVQQEVWRDQPKYLVAQ